MPPPPPPQPYGKSNYQILKEGGWNNTHGFMHTYNLNAWEAEDYGTAKQILKGFREIDRQACEEQYGHHGEFEQKYYQDDHCDSKHGKQITWDTYHSEQEAWENQFYEQGAWEYDNGGDEGWDGDCDNNYGDYGGQGDYGYYWKLVFWFWLSSIFTWVRLTRG